MAINSRMHEQTRRFDRELIGERDSCKSATFRCREQLFVLSDERENNRFPYIKRSSGHDTAEVATVIKCFKKETKRFGYLPVV